MDRTKFPNLSEEFLDQMEKLEKEGRITIKEERPEWAIDRYSHEDFDSEEEAASYSVDLGLIMSMVEHNNGSIEFQEGPFVRAYSDGFEVRLERVNGELVWRRMLTKDDVDNIMQQLRKERKESLHDCIKRILDRYKN